MCKQTDLIQDSERVECLACGWWGYNKYFGLFIKPIKDNFKKYEK